jgi:hypothetical protein
MFCFILPFQAGILLAQNTAGELIREVNAIAARNAIGGLTYRDISGSPYYSPGFTNSIVYLNNGDSAALPLRYDLYQDEIEFQRDATVFWVIKNDVRYIRYGSERLVPEPVQEDPGKPAYFFVPETGRYSLYVRKKVDFSPYVPPQAYADAVPDRFVPLPDEYYLKQKGGPAVRIKNKKVLIEMLGENPPALDYIKKSKIRVNDAGDLLGLVKFLNSQ